MEQDHPVTRRELNEALKLFKTELKTELKIELKTELKAELVDDLTAVMRTIETNLLTAFHSYAQGAAARFGGLEVTDRELRMRMDALESRVLALETRRPPAP
jgi:hypothetical protein